MKDDSIDSKRGRQLLSGIPGTGPVVYWMSRDQRADDNWALLFAQELALQKQKPFLILFCLTTDFLGANLRHYSFLIKGLQEVQRRLADLNLPFYLLLGNPQHQRSLFFSLKKRQLPW